MTKLQRDLISRATAGVFGLALLFGAWKLAGVASEAAAESRERAARLNTPTYRAERNSGAGHLYLFAGVLAIVGLPCVVYAIVPPWVTERLFAPSPPETGDRSMPDVEEFARRWRM